MSRNPHLLADLLAVRTTVSRSWRGYEAEAAPRRCIVQIVEDTVPPGIRRRDVLDELARALPKASRWSRSSSSIMRFDDSGRIDRRQVLRLVNRAARANGNPVAVLVCLLRSRASARPGVPSVVPAE
mgnify:CR=1 FL=1|jgi:hypothetical protein